MGGSEACAWVGTAVGERGWFVPTHTPPPPTGTPSPKP